MKNKKNIFVILFFAVALITASFVLTLQTFSLLESFRFVFGSFFVLFVPGFVWSFIFLEADTTLISNADTTLKKDRLSIIDRTILSFGLSFVMSPLLVFILSKIGIKITFLSCLFEILGLIIVGLVIILIQKFLINSPSSCLRCGYGRQACGTTADKRNKNA